MSGYQYLGCDLPVAFHFRVVLQHGCSHLNASFEQVNGLSCEISVKNVEQSGNNNFGVQVPEAITHGNIELKRSLEPLGEQFSLWLNDCLRFSLGVPITVCDLVIFLMNDKEVPVACWQCSGAYPIKWTASPFSASESKLMMETLTLTYNTLERKL